MPVMTTDTRLPFGAVGAWSDAGAALSRVRVNLSRTQAEAVEDRPSRHQHPVRSGGDERRVVVIGGAVAVVGLPAPAPPDHLARYGRL